jgi:FtsZ-binding cell division protein ZapB
MRRLDSKTVLTREQREVDELSAKKERVAQELAELEARREQLLKANDVLDKKKEAADMRLAARLSQEDVEVACDPIDLEGSKSTNYYSDLEAELLLPSYNPGFLEGILDFE